jgi:hypothetical protein
VLGNTVTETLAPHPRAHLSAALTASSQIYSATWPLKQRIREHDTLWTDLVTCELEKIYEKVILLLFKIK